MSVGSALSPQRRGDVHGGWIQMSKRLRASIRASNRGRALRPKAGRAESTSLLPEEPLEGEGAEALVGAADDGASEDDAAAEQEAAERAAAEKAAAEKAAAEKAAAEK